MRRPSRRTGRAREHDAQHIGRADLLDERPEVQQLLGRCRRKPGAHVGGWRRGDSGPRGSNASASACAQSRSRRSASRLYGRVLTRASSALKPGDVDTGRVVPGLERLHERRARARERIEHASAGGDVPVEQRLDELRDELAEVRVQTVNVLRPLALRQRRLGPGQLEIVRLVERFLGGRHAPGFAARPPRPAVGSATTWRRCITPSRGRYVRRPRFPPSALVRLSGIRSAASSNRDHLESDRTCRVAGSREPHLRRATHAAPFLGVDGPTAPPKPAAAALLHLDEREPAAAPDDQVELVATGLYVRADDAVAPQAVVPERPPLAVFMTRCSRRGGHDLELGSPRSTWPRTRAGAARTAHGPAPPPSDRA